MSNPISLQAKKAAKAKVPANHPPVINMITEAITTAKDRKGSSLPTIKKYIATNYKLDVAKMAPHIRRGIVHGVEKSILIRVANKGKGASGSFKLADKKAVESKPKAVKAKVAKAVKAAKPKKATPKKLAVKKVIKPKAKTPTKPKPLAKKVVTPAKKSKVATKKPKTTAKKVAPKKK